MTTTTPRGILEFSGNILPAERPGSDVLYVESESGSPKHSHAGFAWLSSTCLYPMPVEWRGVQTSWALQRAGLEGTGLEAMGFHVRAVL